MPRLRFACLPALLLAMSACAENGSAEALVVPEGDVQPVIASTLAETPLASAAATDPGVPPGYYECWYWRSVYSPSGFSGELHLSAMGWLRLAADGTYQTGLNPNYSDGDPRVETDTRGRFHYDKAAGAFSFTDSWLTGAVASYETPDDAPPQVVFSEEANLVAGESRIDTNDTKCSFQRS